MAGAGDFLSGLAGGMQTGMSINRMRDDQQQRDQERELEEQRRQQDEEAAKKQEELRQQSQQQPSGQQGMGIDPSMIQSFMSNGSSSGASAGGSGSMFGGAGAGSGASGTGAMGLPTSYTGYLGGSSAAGGSAGGSSMGGAAAAAGPWAALAAVIAVNEKSARNGGHRRDGWQYGKDLIGGKVVEQDTNERWAPKIFGNNDKTGLGADMKAGAEFTTLDFKNGGKQLGKGTIGKVIKKIF